MRALLLLSTLFLLFAGKALGQGTRCDLTKEGAISFSQDDPSDTLLISIRGASCDKAITRIQIADATGKVLLQYSEPLKNAFQRTISDSDARHAIDVMYSEGATKSTKELPAWRPKQQYYSENSQVLSVSKAYYNKIRKLTWRTFSHQVGYEGWKVIVYDRELRSLKCQVVAPNNALENGRSQASLRSLARAVQRGRYPASGAQRRLRLPVAHHDGGMTW